MRQLDMVTQEILFWRSRKSVIATIPVHIFQDSMRAKPLILVICLLRTVDSN